MLMRTSTFRPEPINRFLQMLGYEDRERLHQSLEPVMVQPGIQLFSSGQPVRYLYFPESIVVSIQLENRKGKNIETALVGGEGLIGWSGLAGCEQSSYQAVVQMRPGKALRIPIEDMLAACASSCTLWAAVMRFVEVIMVQMAEAILSHLSDPIDRRVCRWLLMRHDRMTSDQVLARHDDISINLGARRPSVTDCLHILEGDHLIRCHRGRIIIRDRAGIEAVAGNSYGAAEKKYRALIGQSGRLASYAGSQHTNSTIFA